MEVTLWGKRLNDLLKKRRLTNTSDLLCRTITGKEHVNSYRDYLINRWMTEARASLINSVKTTWRRMGVNVKTVRKRTLLEESIVRLKLGWLLHYKRNGGIVRGNLNPCHTMVSEPTLQWYNNGDQQYVAKRSIRLKGWIRNKTDYFKKGLYSSHKSLSTGD